MKTCNLCPGEGVSLFCFSGDFLFWALLFGTFWGIFFIFLGFLSKSKVCVCFFVALVGH